MATPARKIALNDHEGESLPTHVLMCQQRYDNLHSKIEAVQTEQRHHKRIGYSILLGVVGIILQEWLPRLLGG